MTLSLNGTNLVTSANIAAGAVAPADLATPWTDGDLTPTNTSQTSYFLGTIPSWVNRIQVVYQDISLNSTSSPLIQFGKSTGYVTTGYLSSMENAAMPTTSVVTSTAGFIIAGTAAANVMSGVYEFWNVTGNVWIGVAQHIFTNNTPYCSWGVGTIWLGGTLDKIRITTVSGTDTFDGGNVQVRYR